MSERRKGNKAAVAHELHELAGEAYDELHGRYPKAALAIKAGLGGVVPALVQKSSSGLSAPFFKKGRASK